MDPTQSRREGSLPTLALAVGFASLAVAAWAARATPPNGYELSIYAATPGIVWAGVVLAMALALATAFAAPTRGLRRAALALGGSAVTLVALLPLLRNYRYRGTADSFTHLGWARDMAAGTTEPVSIFYPAIHVLGLQFDVLGLSLERGLLLVVVVFLVAFLVFVPLFAREISRDGWVVTLAAVSAWLLLPVNHVGTFMMVYPTTQALFLLPALLFVFLLYLDRRTDDDGLLGPLSITPLAPLLALFGVGLLLVHPQQAANVLILFATGVVLQAVARRRWPDHPVAGHRGLLLQTVFLGAAFVAWVGRRDRFVGAVEGVATGIFAPGLGAVDEVAQRSVSLTDMGVGLETLFLRLFVVGAIYALLSGGLVATLLLRRRGGDRRARAMVAYVVAGLVPLTVLFALYFFNTPTLGFRQVGVLMVFGTVLGAMALAAATRRRGTTLPSRTARSALGVALAAVLVVSLLSTFASPFVFKPSSHVTDEQIDGHAAAFEHRGEDMYYSRLTLAAPTARFADAILGVERSTNSNYLGPRDASVPPSNFNRGTLPRAYERPRYITLSRADYARSVRLYDGFRYEREGFERLPRQKGLNRVLSNGVFRLYVVGGA